MTKPILRDLAESFETERLLIRMDGAMATGLCFRMLRTDAGHALALGPSLATVI